MPLTLQPSLPENAAQRVVVQLASYSDDPLIPSMMPRVSHSDKIAFFAKMGEKEAANPWVKDLEIVDTDTGKVVAYARWKYPFSQTSEGGNFEIPTYPEGTDMTLCEALFAAFKELTDKYYDSEKMYFLNNMHVLPEYQRRGLGARLMEQALKDADRDGAQASLLATDGGKKLYSKFGFKELETKDLDFRHLGASGRRNTTAMLREPQSLPN